MNDKDRQTRAERPADTEPRPRVVAVVNLKGGTGKTTTAAFLGHAWAASGLRVTFVDADHPQYALSRWAELAAWNLPVMGLGSKQLHVQLPGILTSATCDLAVVDTPPLEEHRGIVTAALRAADDIVVTLAPTTAELHRTGAVFDAIDDVAPLRAMPARVTVCLNRVDRRARADRVIRAALTDAGHHVLDHDVPLRQAYAQAFGSVVIPDRIWTDLAQELGGEDRLRFGGAA